MNLLTTLFYLSKVPSIGFDFFTRFLVSIMCTVYIHTTLNFEYSTLRQHYPLVTTPLEIIKTTVIFCAFFLLQLTAHKLFFGYYFGFGHFLSFFKNFKFWVEASPLFSTWSFQNDAFVEKTRLNSICHITGSWQHHLNKDSPSCLKRLGTKAVNPRCITILDMSVCENETDELVKIIEQKKTTTLLNWTVFLQTN